MASRQYAHEDYTIGWICALPKTELVAAAAMLDEEHPVLPAADPQDANSYLLGRIGDHNVVIACLPAETTGKISAATVARDMIRSFPSIRFGLMVGIGGGVPYHGSQRQALTAKTDEDDSDDSEDGMDEIPDIRLGDVVVSLHTKTTEAVVQYDFGKSLQAKGFVRAGGQLNKPPNIVLNAIARLQANHARGHHTIPELLSKMLAANPAMVNFQHPGCEKDRLFKAEFVHLEGKKSCKACCGPDNANLVKRGSRTDTAPKIYYGAIGSADQVMKNGILRDQWASKESILCFEMEAAGFMDSFPCLVIRGICDYADSHKNKMWQPYAAATAAAYAKELLVVIPGQGLTKLSPIKQLLHLSEQIEAVNSGLGKAFEQRENHHHDQVMRYLTEDQRQCHQVFKTSSYEEFKNNNPNRVKGTCEWVLKSPEYLRWWNATSNDLLWISADPGCGKSVLAKALIDDVFAASDPNISILYFFFKDHDKQNNLASALCAVLHQLFSLQPQLLRHALPFWERNQEKIQYEVDDMWRIFMAAMSDPEFGDTICVFDALDECHDHDQKLLIEKLCDFYNRSLASQGNWLKFLVTSRPYDDIQIRFRPVTECFPHIHLRGEEENDQIHEEINLVVKVKLAELGKDLDLCDDTRERLERELCNMKHRTYLWLYLAIDDIKLTLKNSLRPDRETIPPLPKNVPEAYGRILDRVPSDQKTKVKIILRIVVGARRPLTVQEMAMALGVATTPSVDIAIEAGLSPRGLDRKIRQLCGLFVFIKESKIYLIHQTAREFLISKHNGSDNIHWHLEQRKTDVQMTEICVKYLLMNDLISNDAESVRSLLDYSAENWADHFRDVLFPEAELVNWVWKLYDVGTELFSLWFPKFWKITMPYQEDSQMKALHLAAFNNHPKILCRITLETTSTLDLMDGSGRTALLWASERGHSEIIRLLLEKGADINAQGGENGNALQYAAREGNIEIVQLLLEKGADINAQGGENGNALQCAAREGNIEIVQLLLEKGADVHAQDGDYGNALQGAVRRGHLEIVQLLVENGADVNARHQSTAEKLDRKHGNPSYKPSASGMTALHFSALNGSVGMTKSLCFHHANPNAQSKTGDTPLHLAIRRRMLGIRNNDYRMNGEYSVEDLSDFTDPGSEEFFEILRQIDESRVRIVDVLLSTVSIDVNFANHNGDCPLHVLPFRKDCASEITLKLIEKGAEVSKSNNKRQTCLHLACKAGNVNVVRILVSRGCSIILQDIYGLSPLHYAVEDGSPDVVRYLLEQYPHHALDNCQQRDFLQMKLLHHHVKSLMPSVEIIKLLSQHGLEPNELDENGDSVLSLYLRSLRLGFKAGIFDCLIEIGASMSWVGKASEGLIHLVMCQWDKSNSLILERLLQVRDIRAKDNKGRNILHHGAIHGAFDKSLTNFLREKNIFSLLNENDFQGKTPLDYAEEETRCERGPDSFGEGRWNESLQNFKILHEETI